MPFDLGATVRLTAKCVDADGSAATAGTATATVTLPDGTTATPAASETMTGTYQVDYVTTAPGRHTVRWVFTNPAHAYTDVFDVQEASPGAILSLADAKQHLNIASAQDDDEIRYWNTVTTRAVEFYTGPIIARTVTEDHDVGWVRTLALRQVPAISLTSVVAILVGGTSYLVADLDLDAETGIVRRKDDGWLHGPLRATYTAGRTVIRDNMTGAARIIIQHLWRTQRPGRRGALAGGGEDYSVTEPIPGLGYAIPNRALELLAPDRLPPGVA